MGLAAAACWVKRTARFVTGGALDLVYPPVCAACGGRHDPKAATPLCAECRAALAPIGPKACPRCGLPLGPHTAGRRACPRDHQGLIFRSAAAVCRYHGVGERLVKGLKFGRDLRALEVMGPMLAERVAAAPFAEGIEVVVPTPLHWLRRAARRFNQAGLLAERVAERIGAELEGRALKRIRNTTPQALLPARERTVNLRGAFAVVDVEAVRGARVLLVDDVMTTCHTAKECSLELSRAGARSIDVAVFAR